VWSEGFYVNEKPLTPAGIEPATFRIVAQHLNHCATAVPTVGMYLEIILTRSFVGLLDIDDDKSVL